MGVATGKSGKKKKTKTGARVVVMVVGGATGTTGQAGMGAEKSGKRRMINEWWDKTRFLLNDYTARSNLRLERTNQPPPQASEASKQIETPAQNKREW